MSRRVLLVGATSPIGAAIAAAFAREGGSVLGVGRGPAPTGAGADALADYLDLDAGTPEGAGRAVDHAVERLGGLDVLVPAAAVMPVAPATETTPEQWRAAMANTLDTVFFPARHALRVMGPGSGIVAVGSVNGSLAAPGLPGYAAAKAGVEGLVRQLALEYGPKGVRVNAVAPGMIGHAELPGAAEGYPLCRTGEPEEVAEAVLFLASERASFVTGVVLPVDGGLSIASPAAFLRPDLRARFLPR